MIRTSGASTIAMSRSIGPSAMRRASAPGGTMTSVARSVFQNGCFPANASPVTASAPCSRRAAARRRRHAVRGGDFEREIEDVGERGAASHERGRVDLARQERDRRRCVPRGFGGLTKSSTVRKSISRSILIVCGRKMPAARARSISSLAHDRAGQQARFEHVGRDVERDHLIGLFQERERDDLADRKPDQRFGGACDMSRDASR